MIQGPHEPDGVAKTSFTAMISLAAVAIGLTGVYRLVANDHLGDSAWLRVALALFAGTPVAASILAYMRYIGSSDLGGTPLIQVGAWYQFAGLGGLLVVLIGVFLFSIGTLPLDDGASLGVDPTAVSTTPTAVP